MAVIVLVHGIAQEQKSADTLEHEWVPDLSGGVRLAGFAQLADRLANGRAAPEGIDVRMAFYGDLFLRGEEQGGGPPDLGDDGGELANELAREWLQRAGTRSSSESTRQLAIRELAYVDGRLGEEQGRGAFARRAVNGLAKVKWFAPVGVGLASRFVRKELAQVTRYLTDDTIRTKVLERVEGVIGPETRVLIGHSLGSVVAYEAAQRMMLPLPLLVTLGSPLGLHTVVYQKLRPQPPTFPATVARWVNVADRNDFIAAEPDLTAMFSGEMPDGAIFEGGFTVDNGAEPHRADYYLTKETVGRSIGEVLSALP